MDQSHGAKPFRFATEFAVAPPHQRGDMHATALEVAALRAELEALRSDHAVELSKARSEGYMEALAQMRAEREQAMLAALDALHAEWEEFADTRDAMMEQLREEAGALSLSIGEALAARELSDAPGEAIDQAIGRVLGQIARGQEVTVSVHPDLAEDIETRIVTRQAGDRRKLNLVVLADEALAPGDAHLRWEAGGLRLDAEARRQAVIEELTAMGIV
jgi:flagellar assembly protein FliH